MSHTVAISFKYKTEGLSRWTYLSVFQANSSYGSKTYFKTYQGPEEVNSSLLNPVQPKAEKCPQGDHKARSSSTLLKECSQGKPSMRSCLSLLKPLRYSTLRNLNVQAEPDRPVMPAETVSGESPCEQDSALQVPSEATV